MSEQTARICPECGRPLPQHTNQPLCPKCLLGMAVTTVPGASPTAEARPFDRGLPTPGDQLGHYKILSLLGEGGMGAVFEAQDTETGRQVALKVLSQALDSPASRQRFFREGRLAASLNHPNSVYVFGTEEIGGIPVIAMELVGGGTLQDRVRKRGPLPPREAVDAALQIIAGLEAAQKLGILHRDIKPSNCFVGPGGTVKVGDFGLSISTSIRLEPSLTATGAILGTPAFSSPEQLRGDDLSIRADMYSLGATLFYLLTGRTPFEGKNEVQLLAAVLEKRPPSPRELRPEVPRGLARVVLRCLDKQPAERFRTYADLAAALLPYASSAPTPATLGLRFAAGLVDFALLSTLSTIAAVFAGDSFKLLTAMAQAKPEAMAWAALALLGSVSYYALFEAFRGATPGKALFGLRVVATDQTPASLGRTFGRALIYVVLPAMPFWILYGTQQKIFYQSIVWQQAFGFLFYVVLASLFSTARRRNGYAAVQDLVTGTRVIAREALQLRPVLAVDNTVPVLDGVTRKIGPYHVLETLASGPAEEWLLGYDLCLLRKVWIRKVPPGSPPASAELRNLGRATRLRWLGGHRSLTENWDTYEAPTGAPLLRLRSEWQWKKARFWLYDLASELAAALKDNTIPAVLSPDRVWITAEGGAKLLDFPAPGLIETNGAAETGMISGPDTPPRPDIERCKRFLAETAAIALAGPAAREESPPRTPLPLHARDFLERLPLYLDLDSVVLALKPLLSRVAVVSRARRLALVIACLPVPVFAVLALMAGETLLHQSGGIYSDLVGLNTVLQVRERLNSSRSRNNPLPTDRQFAIYIASHYRPVITNEATWSSPIALSMLKQPLRAFAEKSIADHPSPAAEERMEAETAVKSLVDPPLLREIKKKPAFQFGFTMACLAFYVGLPALVAAVCFRGGLVLLAAGVTYATRDGRPAGRLPLLWRAMVAWSIVPASIAVQLSLKPVVGASYSVLAGILTLVVPVFLSVLLSERGVPERLSGTWPVPR